MRYPYLLGTGATTAKHNALTTASLPFSEIPYITHVIPIVSIFFSIIPI